RRSRKHRELGDGVPVTGRAVTRQFELRPALTVRIVHERVPALDPHAFSSRYHDGGGVERFLEKDHDETTRILLRLDGKRILGDHGAQLCRVAHVKLRAETEI